KIAFREIVKTANFFDEGRVFFCSVAVNNAKLLNHFFLIDGEIECPAVREMIAGMHFQRNEVQVVCWIFTSVGNDFFKDSWHRNCVWTAIESIAPKFYRHQFAAEMIVLFKELYFKPSMGKCDRGGKST